MHLESATKTDVYRAQLIEKTQESLIIRRVPALPYLLVTVSLLKIEPVQPAIEYALRKAAPEVIEAVCDGEHLIWERFGGLQHGG